MTEPDPASPRPGLNFTFRWMLRRLVRLGLSFSMPYPTMEALLKRCYIESATDDFCLPGKPQTDSRIALLTGLNRSDLRRLRAQRDADEPLPTSFEWRVAMRWGEAPFLDPSGMRAPLPRLASAGAALSFDALVQSVSTDIRPAAVLSHWLSTGAAQVDADDCVRFDADAFFQSEGGAHEQAMLLAYVLGDLVQGYVANMPKPQQRPLHVRAHWLTRLTPASVQQLNAAATKLIEASDSLRALGTQLEDADRDHPDARQRYMFVSYRYHADMAADPPFPLPV